MNDFFSKPRIVVLATIFFLVTLYIIVTYGKLAFTPPQQIIQQTELPRRGSIFDRNGKPLAVQTDFYHIVLTPSAIENEEVFASILAPVTDLTEEYILASIISAQTDFLYLKKQIDQAEKDIIEQEIRKNSLSGIRFDTIPGRVYPENTLASQVIGFMGYDGVGLSGIEYSMQNIFMPQDNESGKSAVGKNVFLTIDANLQYKLEQIAYAAMEETQAESFMLVAAAAKSGEILSYISLPAANLNTYPSSTPEEKIDRPAVLAYEPGSVFKIFSVASFVDSGEVSENDIFICDSRHEITAANGEKAVITCLGYHGEITAREALQYSCNDAIAQMSDRMSSEDFLAMIRKFGFGTRTGVEVPSETRGSVKTTSDRFWSIRSKPTMAMGQELSVSALQMVQAAIALANGGIPLELSFISKITDSDGITEYEHSISPKEAIISKSTADYLLSCMETTAQQGTGTRAALADISIGVKTGTAQMTDIETGAYSETDFVSNVAAIFPVDDPEIVLYIVITRAKGETLSGRIVAPVIADAADVIIDHLGLARASAASLEHSGIITFQTDEIPILDTVVPDFTGVAKRLLTPLLGNPSINFLVEGDGWVVSQNPLPGTSITEGMTIELYLE